MQHTALGGRGQGRQRDGRWDRKGPERCISMKLKLIRGSMGLRKRT
jgi:hypothetical protein